MLYNLTVINKKVFFETINNKQVFCHLSEVDGKDKKMVIMSHGFRGASIGPARQFVDFEKILTEEGFSVIRFDQPNSGNSEGEYINSSFTEWINTIVYFAKKYLTEGYKVSLLGQSMGATATVAASNHPDIKGKIPCLLLWVPDAKTTFKLNSDEIFEEGGQKYKGSFWNEASNSNFVQCLEAYEGGIHLVYGDKDRYITKELRDNAVEIVKSKKQPYMILKGQDHSPWEYDLIQGVYKEELAKLKECMA